jgi:TRAP transporter TAXI family solute receptor
MLRKLTAVLMVALATLSIVSSARAEQFVRIASGLAGTYPVFGAKLAEMMNKNIPDVRASTLAGPTEQGLIRIDKGDAEFGLAYTYQTVQLRNGDSSLNVKAENLRHVMSLYGAYFMVVVQQKSDIKSLADLKTKPYRVWLGTKASTFYALNVAALAAHGVTPEDITKAGGVLNTAGYQNLAQAFQDGQVDVAFFSGPSPYGPMMELDRAPGFRVLSFDKAAGEKMMELLPGVTMRELKGGVYKSMTETVNTPYLINELVVSAKVSDDLVYKVTKMLNEQNKEFHGLFPGADEVQTSAALEGNKIPLHPGAERYYREVKLLK